MSTWLSSGVLAGGMESPAPSRNEKEKFSRQTSSSSYETGFVASLANPDVSDSDSAAATTFYRIVSQFCRQNNLAVPLQFPPDHPVELAGRRLMACLIKHCDLVPAALGVVDVDQCRLPASLVEVCRVVYRAKMKMIQDHQGSSRRYDDVCRTLVERCQFLLNEIRPASAKVALALNRRKVLGMRSRWATAARKIAMQRRSRSGESPVKTTERIGAGVSVGFLRQSSRGIEDDEVRENNFFVFFC